MLLLQRFSNIVVSEDEVETETLNIKGTYSNITQNTNILYSYSGEINQEVLREVVNYHDDVLTGENKCSTFKRKVITLLIETLQNITRYGEKAENKYPIGDFITWYDGHLFHFECSNSISDQQYRFLSQNLQELSVLDLDQLKNHYALRLNQQWEKPENGAKLGLLYLFINSEKNLSYSFEEKNKNTYLFSLKVSLKK